MFYLKPIKFIQVPWSRFGYFAFCKVLLSSMVEDSIICPKQVSKLRCGGDIVNDIAAYVMHSVCRTLVASRIIKMLTWYRGPMREGEGFDTILLCSYTTRVCLLVCLNLSLSCLDHAGNQDFKVERDLRLQTITGGTRAIL